MELWNKLFTHRKKSEVNKAQKTITSTVQSSQNQPGGGSPPFHLAKDGIRVLLFRECDARGRKLLYDSKTVVQVPVTENTSNVSSCKAPFKSSRTSGSSVTSLPSGGISSAAQQFQVTTNKISSNLKSSGCSSPKLDVFAEISGGYGYQYMQQENDTKMLGELVFGTVALAYKGSCSKLHLLQNPHRILLSRISPAPHSYLRPSGAGSDQGIEDSSFSSSFSSLSEAISRADSLEMHWGPAGGGGGSAWAVDMPCMLSTSHSEGDSGFGGPPSPYSSVCGSFLSPSLPTTPHGTPSSRQGSGGSLKNSGSLNSLQRRFLRNVNTSLDALGREGEILEEGTTLSSQRARRVTKLGIAVIINLGSGLSELERHVEEWLFLHLGVIEASMNKLQSCLDSAYLHRQSFVSTTHQAVTQLQQDMLDLVSGPRLSQPVWLGLLGKPSASERQILCTSFVNTLASVLNAYDTKQTNFFVSKLLTAALTYHLGWVSTVAPGDHRVSTPTISTLSTAAQASWVERLSESHPYSAIWAQLCELCGAVGYPPRAARTLLVGSDAPLLAQLLTILSYIIRCSQVVEQDVQHLKVESNTTADQHPYFSRTSSIASIVTIVEGSRRDSQRDVSKDLQHHTRQSSQVQVQRESSMRRNWRTNWEGRSSRLLSTESRGGSGENTSDLTMKASYTSADEPQRGSTCEFDSVAVSQQSNRKETDQASKWMLNDGEEIVIRDAKCSATLSCRSDIDNQVCLEEKGGKLKSKSEVVLLKPSESIVRTLSSSKTATNLTSLVDNDSIGSGPNVSYTGHNDISSKALRETSEHLYPTLYELDDHRETFGPVTLEPEIIAGKVQKLFRGSSVLSSSQEQRQERLVPEVSLHHSVSQEPCQLRVNKQIMSQPVRNITTLPRTKKSEKLNAGFQRSEIGFNDIAQLNLNEENSANRGRDNGKCFDTGEVSPRSQNWEKISSAEVTVPAKNIHPEVEEGGKVLFLMGEIEKVEGSKDLAETEKRTNLQVKSESGLTCVSLDSNVTPAIGFEGIGDMIMKTASEFRTSEAVPLQCLPSPVDTRKIVRIRNVGRDSARDLTKLDKEKVIYPSLKDFKQDLKQSGNCGTKDSAEIMIKKHRRHHSDPTNGVFNPKILVQFSAELLKDVAEEQVTDKASTAGKKLMKSVDHKPEILPYKPKTSPRTKEGESLKCNERKPHSVLKESDCALDQLSQIDSTSEDTEANAPIASEQPVNIHMPRCVCVNNSSSGGSFLGDGRVSGCSSSSLAGSLLGGVMDHYSSVFVVHATTQTHHWEDALRQDLSAAAHCSTLDQQVAEAVAVVADTNTWEVQLVSSHSYIVEHGGSGVQVGLRVGMSPLVSAITDSVLDLTRMDVNPQFVRNSVGFII
ncbi:uncharacterized protein [Panulirus ornatus]|uniref:uncharacterized protein n=1 Tax=Panulirus ornatus TaxID=150431 RepID=UPI003A853BD1